MIRYKVGASRLYIDKQSFEPGEMFSRSDALPNEASLVASGAIEVVPTGKEQAEQAKELEDATNDLTDAFLGSFDAEIRARDAVPDGD